jgi:5'-nucleotidase
MRILLSNDDGIDAPGLAALRAGIDDLGEVTVAAPDSPQSAAGHAITLIHPLTVQRVTISAPKPFAGLSISGRPADCVRLAIRKLLPEPPELVVSGINAGANVGINVFYSGTVAAAAEAAMMGIPAVAFSASVESGTVDFPAAAGLCRSILDWLLETGLARGELLNVNIPDLGKGRPVGVRVVRQSTAELEDYYHEHLDATGAEMYRVGESFRFSPEQETTDVVSLAEGYITVTPLHVDMTNHARLARLERLAVPDVS